MSSDWEDIIPALAQKLGYRQLQSWQADLTRKLWMEMTLYSQQALGRGNQHSCLLPCVQNEKWMEMQLGSVLHQPKHLVRTRYVLLLTALLHVSVPKVQTL